MSQLTPHAEGKILDHLRGQALELPANFYVGLHTAEPFGPPVYEVSGAAYRRQRATFLLAMEGPPRPRGRAARRQAFYAEQKRRRREPCYTGRNHLGKPDYDHDLEFVDESFDHEFGTERVHSWECQACGRVFPVDASDFDGWDEG